MLTTPPGHSPPGWLFESHVGEQVIKTMLLEAKVNLVYSVGAVEHVLMGSCPFENALTGQANTTCVQAVTFENLEQYHADVWIDASYEGGIAERVATMTWGRESINTYNENSAGVNPPASIGATVNPYWNTSIYPYDFADNIIPHVAHAAAAHVGNGDLWIEPYDFRLCFTNSPGNKANFTKPANYNASEFELWRRIYKEKPPTSLEEAGLGCLGWCIYVF